MLGIAIRDYSFIHDLSWAYSLSSSIASSCFHTATTLNPSTFFVDEQLLLLAPSFLTSSSPPPCPSLAALRCSLHRAGALAQTNKTSGNHVGLNPRRVPARTLTIYTPFSGRSRAAMQRVIAGDTLWLPWRNRHQKHVSSWVLNAANRIEHFTIMRIREEQNLNIYFFEHFVRTELEHFLSMRVHDSNIFIILLFKKFEMFYYLIH